MEGGGAGEVALGGGRVSVWLHRRAEREGGFGKH